MSVSADPQSSTVPIPVADVINDAVMDVDPIAHENDHGEISSSTKRKSAPVVQVFAKSAPEFMAASDDHPINCMYFHNPGTDKFDRITAPSDGSSIIDSFTENMLDKKIINKSTAIFLDSTFLGDSPLPPKAITAGSERWELVHWFLAVKNNTLFPNPGSAFSSKPTSSSVDADAVDAYAECDGCVVDADTPEQVACVTENDAPPDSTQVEVSVPEPGSKKKSGNSHTTSRSRALQTPPLRSKIWHSSMTHTNSIFGKIHNVVIGVYLHSSQTSEIAMLKGLVSFSGDNIIDVSAGRNFTRSVIDHISVFWFSTRRLMVLPPVSKSLSPSVDTDSAAHAPLSLLHDQDTASQPGLAASSLSSSKCMGSMSAFSGWCTTHVLSDHAFPAMNVTYIARSPTVGTKLGVLKMIGWLQKHPSISNATNMARVWRHYSNDPIAMATWSRYSGPDQMLSSWPEPGTKRYVTLDFIAVYNLLLTEIARREKRYSEFGSWLNGQKCSGANSNKAEGVADMEGTDCDGDGDEKGDVSVHGKKKQKVSNKSTGHDNDDVSDNDKDSKKRTGPRLNSKSRLSRMYPNKRKRVAAILGDVNTSPESMEAVEQALEAETKKARAASICKPLPVCDQIVDFVKLAGFSDKLVDGNKIPRSTFRTVLWGYIKSSKLQLSKEDGLSRFLVPDSTLAAILKPKVPLDPFQTSNGVKRPSPDAVEQMELSGMLTWIFEDPNAPPKVTGTKRKRTLKKDAEDPPAVACE